MTNRAPEAFSFVVYAAAAAAKAYCLRQVISRRDLGPSSKALWLVSLHFAPGLAVPAYFLTKNRDLKTSFLQSRESPAASIAAVA